MGVAFKSSAKVNGTISLEHEAGSHADAERPTLKWGDTQPANPRKFERWSTNIDPQNGAEEIQFDPLDPSNRQTKITPEGYIDAGSGGRYAQPFTLIRIILADCGRRQDHFQFRNSVEDGLNKCV